MRKYSDRRPVSPTILSKADWPRRAIVGFSAIGVLDSLYLIWLKISDADGGCGGLGDCVTVNSSIYSELFGIPIAGFGLIFYLSVIGISALEDRHPGARGWGVLSIFGLSLVGTLYSAWLTYVEVAILRAICLFCVASALLITAILIASIVRVQRHVYNP